MNSKFKKKSVSQLTGQENFQLGTAIATLDKLIKTYDFGDDTSGGWDMAKKAIMKVVEEEF